MTAILCGLGGKLRPTSFSIRERRRARRDARKHAKRCQKLGLPERAERWRKRARNG